MLALRVEDGLKINEPRSNHKTSEKELDSNPPKQEGIIKRRADFNEIKANMKRISKTKSCLFEGKLTESIGLLHDQGKARISKVCNENEATIRDRVVIKKVSCSD